MYILIGVRILNKAINKYMGLSINRETQINNRFIMNNFIIRNGEIFKGVTYK